MLARRGYQYDASTFPTFLGPLARMYYFLTARLTAEQKAELAEIDSLFNAKIAERKIFLTDQISKAVAAGKFDEVESLEKQLTADVIRLQEDCEQKKEKLRATFGAS